MRPLTLSDQTRLLQPPANWNAEAHGECMALSIHDRVVDGKAEMVSAWLPDDEDLLRLNAGHALMLTIGGTSHPVVSLGSSAEPVKDAPTVTVARSIAAVIGAAVEARIETSIRLHPNHRLLVSQPVIDGAGVAIGFHLVSPVEVIPFEYKDWQVFGPFGLATASVGDGGMGGSEKL